MSGLHDTAAVAEQPRPAIRFMNYMGDREEMEAVHIIGPYEDAEARNRELRRLEGLPLGAPEYNGGVQFFPATMTEAVGERGWSLYVVEPAQVSSAATVRGFFAAFHGCDDVEEVWHEFHDGPWAGERVEVEVSPDDYEHLIVHRPVAGIGEWVPADAYPAQGRYVRTGSYGETTVMTWQPA